MKGTKLAFFKLFGFKVCIPEYMHPFLWNLNESPELVVHYYYLMKVEARIHYSDGNVRFANVENLRWYMHRSDAIGADLWTQHMDSLKTRPTWKFGQTIAQSKISFKYSNAYSLREDRKKSKAFWPADQNQGIACIQPGNSDYKRLLNKPYVNEVTLRRQNPPLKCC